MAFLALIGYCSASTSYPISFFFMVNNMDVYRDWFGGFDGFLFIIVPILLVAGIWILTDCVPDTFFGGELMTTEQGRSAAQRPSEVPPAPPARVPYLEPRDLGDPQGRCERILSSVPLEDSYADQRHIWVDGDRRHVLRAAQAPHLTDGPPAEVGRDGWLISAWNPRGKATTLHRNQEFNRGLVDAVEASGGVVERVLFSVPPTREWLEETALIRSLTETEATALARAFGQAAFSVWSGEVLEIIPTGLDESVSRLVQRATLQVAPMTCPMILEDDDVNARCTLHGGPYTSRSIHAAALWRAHRTLLMDRLGCAACENGTLPTNGPFGAAVGGVSLGSICIASRHSGYAWISD